MCGHRIPPLAIDNVHNLSPFCRMFAIAFWNWSIVYILSPLILRIVASLERDPHFGIRAAAVSFLQFLIVGESLSL